DQALDGIAAATLTNQQVQRALDLATNTLGNAASSARLRLVTSWGQRDPAAAAAWVSTLRDPNEKSQLARNVAQTWIAYEPATAVPWLLENTPQAERPTVVEQATSIWVNSDPNATAEWLSTIPKGRDSDLGVSTLARNIVAIEPDAALGWAKTIENKTMRRQTLIAVISQWRMREPERAVELLKASGLPTEEIDDYLKRTEPAQ
ncbi:MAG: triosephosphate isomerase, partial [Verrucomicrobiales bacterium]